MSLKRFTIGLREDTYNILKELAIKNDLQQKKITIQDWTLYGFKSDWILE